jgi:hypothetical protein
MSFIVLAIIAHITFLSLHINRDWVLTQLYATGQKPDALLVAGARLGIDKNPDARFFVASYYKSFLEAEVLASTIGAEEKARLQQQNPTSPAEMWERLYQNGVTDIMIYRLTHPTLLGQSPSVKDAPEWLQVTEEEYSPIVSIFRLRSRGGSPQPYEGCKAGLRKGLESAWQIEPGL